MSDLQARCGVTYEHAWHAFRDDNGQRQICDGKPRHPTTAEEATTMSPRPGAQVTYARPQTVEWGTPQDFFDAIHAEFGFTLDVAASDDNAKVPRYFTIEDDGLDQDWRGEVCWMNPPYGREIADWMRKAYETGIHGNTVVCLVPARTDTRWWWDYAIHGEVRFFKGRLSFTGGSQSNPESHNAPFPMALVVFGRPPSISWAPRPDLASS